MSFNIASDSHSAEGKNIAYAADILNAPVLLDDAVSSGVYIPLQPTDQRTIGKYVVKEGDTLTGIAETLDVSVDTIVSANNIIGGSIKPGQELLAPWTSGVVEEIPKGGSFAKLIEKYKDFGISQKIIERANNFSSDHVLAAGEKVLIPGVEPIVPTVSRNPAYVDSGRSRGYVSASKAPIVKGNGNYVWPVDGRITQRFGTGGHQGIDIAGRSGDAIVAVADGTVLKSFTSGWNGGYGNYVLIEHSNGIRTLYAHNISVAVKVGEKVSAGQIISYRGSTGRSTGPHLHFEAMTNSNGKWVKFNPQTLYK